MPHRERIPADAVEIELIRSLYEAFVPSVIMSVGFTASGGLIVWQTGDRLLLLLLVCGALACLGRLLIAWRDARVVADLTLSIGEARRLERRFTTVYLTFAVILGAFAARVVFLPRHDAHMLMLCLVIGYGAGVASGIGLRPRIAIPSMLVAIVPCLLVALTYSEALYWASAGMTAAFLAGGIYSLRKRHERALEDIGRRLIFASLARRDILTGLPNRLGLREWFDKVAVERGDDRNRIAVHCLDLDGFKPVNDSFGHPIGDAVLVTVAQRLGASIRSHDIAARLGGDEFAVIQGNVVDLEDAHAFARHLRAAINRPYEIEGREISISTCLGYVVSGDRGHDLDQLIAHADQALYVAKRGSGSISRYEATNTSDRVVAA